jgi:two-component system sensor histidine kinase VicK
VLLPRRVSIRWWLGLAFAAIAAVTAVGVAELYTHRADHAFRRRAAELAAGNTVSAAESVRDAIRRGELGLALPAIAARWHLRLFVYDDQGRLINRAGAGRTGLDAVPSGPDALASALAEHRFVDSISGRRFVVGLPLRAGPAAALVAVAARPDLRAELGIVRNGIIWAAIAGTLIGAAVGLVVAVMISLRLRRISSVAAEIEGGNFETRISPRFRDELGELAETVDRMSGRLQESFASLEAERDRLRRLLEQLHEGVVAVDRDLSVQFANRMARQMLRAGLHAGRPLPEPWPQLSLGRLAEGLFDPEASLVHGRVSDGERTHAVVGIPPSPGSSLAVLVFTDVSERERRERAEREFVANAAHELRTPLAALASAVEALESGAKDAPEERDRFLELIGRQVNRLGRLARALLVLARAQTRQEALRLEPVGLRPLLEEVASGLNPRDGVDVSVLCPPGLSALGHRDLLLQAISNLAHNAVKHTERGTITLAARSAGDGSVTIEVADTGTGIPAGEQERIFDRFYSGDRETREGFGLGLAIVREAVRALGGIVEVDSQPDAGTSVRVILATPEVSAA